MADYIKNRKFYLFFSYNIKIHILCTMRAWVSAAFILGYISEINMCSVSILSTDYDSTQTFCRRIPFGEGGIFQTLLYIFTCFFLYSSLYIMFQVDANRTKEAVFEDLEKVFDSWIGDHGSDSYIVVCDECNRNTVTICPHIKH